MVEYLASKNRQYYYNTIPVETLVITRQVDDNPVEIANAWKVSVLGVILVRIFPHSDYEFGKTRTSITPNMNTFYVVYRLHKTEPYPFQTLEKTFLQRISREIIPVVYNLISKFLLVKLLLIMERMMQIWKTLLRSLIKLNRHLFPCSLEVPLGRFMSSKLQERPRRPFWSIRTLCLAGMRYFQTRTLTKAVRSRNVPIHLDCSDTQWNLRHSFGFKLQASSRNFIKKETLAQVFSCEFCEISKNTFYHRTPLVAASVHLILYHFYLVLMHSVNILAHILFHYFFSLYFVSFLFKFIFNCSCWSGYQVSFFGIFLPIILLMKV